MKMKRFVAPDMRQAMRLVRGELGPDAVILSTQSNDNGVEVITAIDYDADLVESTLQLDEAASSNRPVTVAPMPPPTPRKSGERVRDKSGRFVSTGNRPAKRGTSKPSRSAARSAGRKDLQLDGRQLVAAASAATRVAATGAAGADEPGLDGMRLEVKSMRRLLKAQLSSLAWNDLSRRRPGHASALRELARVGIAPTLARELVEDIDWDHAHAPDPDNVPAMLDGSITVLEDELIESGGAIAVVGPTGVGKTTSVAKLAARFALRHGSDQLALITTDNFRIGAHEQLMTFARILDVPVRFVSDAAELSTALDELGGRRLVLIDTAGMSQRDLRLSDQFAVLEPSGERIRVLLTLSAQTQLATLDEVVRAFSHLSPSACLLTKLDEAVSLGPALSVLIRHGLPLAYTTDGQKVPEDIRMATDQARTLLQLAAQRAAESGEVPEEASMAQTFGGVLAHG